MSSSTSAAVRPGSIGGTLTWVLAVVGCIAVIALLVYNRRQRRRFGFPVRPMWAEALIGVAGCAGRPRGRGGRERQLLATRPRRGLRDRERDLSGRAADLVRLPVAGPPPGRRDHRDDLPRHPAKVRALRLRLRRKPGSRGAGRHQHALDHHEDVHADGPAVRDRRSGRIGTARTARRSTSGRATSSTSSPRPSSAGHPSRAASAPSRARSSEPS